jgi:hypothetical protein
MKTRVQELVAQGDRLFEKRRPLLSLWQTQAENFCPIRADFTTSHTLGQEFASHLMTGRPVLAHRDLGNSLSAMLRPRGQAWFHPRTGEEKINTDAGPRAFLDRMGDTMRRVMYDQKSQFTRATKQGDHDFIAFGQTPISIDVRADQTGLLYRTWHLRDVAWCENDELVVDTVHHDWKRTAIDLTKRFKTVAQAVHDCVKKEPYKEIKCRRIVLPADSYDLAPDKQPRNRGRFPFVSIMVDVENQTILEEVPARRVPYVIPRWQTVPGSQYAHSPATVVALPDARLLQQMTLTLLEAGQKAVDPPMKATFEAVQGAVNTYAGGITWVDRDYDEKNGAALERLMDSPGDLRWGESREEKIEQLIQEAFFLNVINLPEATAQGEKMTATETAERVKEYIRRALPLFEPMEAEYNGGLCEMTFDLCMDMNAFGSFEDMPQALRGQDIVWQFESPLQAANERIKSEAFKQSAELLAIAAEMAQFEQYDFDTSAALREALSGIARSDWIVPKEKADEARAQGAQMKEAMAAAQALSAGAGVATEMGVAAKTAGEAGQALQAAGQGG